MAGVGFYGILMGFHVAVAEVFFCRIAVSLSEEGLSLSEEVTGEGDFFSCSLSEGGLR